VIGLVAADMITSCLILERMQSEIPLIPELAGHLIGRRGKRMRPLLTLAAPAADYSGTRHFSLAAAVESSTPPRSSHDDVVDARGCAAAAAPPMSSEASGERVVGDSCSAARFRVMVEDGSLRCCASCRG